MIYFYANKYITTWNGNYKVYRRYLYLAVRGHLPEATANKIRTHIQHVWEKNGNDKWTGNRIVSWSKRREDHRVFNEIHPEYEEIAKRIEQRFASLRDGKVVRYGHPDVTRVEWIIADVVGEKSMAYQRLMQVRKKFKYDIWYARYKADIVKAFR